MQGFSLKKYYHKFLILFLVFAFLITGGLGCKGLSAQEKEAMKPINLEYWTVFDDVDQIRALINQYTLPRKYLKVTVRQLREDELYKRLVEQLAEDRGPDIISIHNRMLPAFRSKIATMPASVSDTVVFTVKKKLGSETKVQVSNINLPTPYQIDAEYVSAVKNDVVFNDQVYGLPLSVDTLALYYNKDLLDRSGVAQPPTNWSQFQAAVKKVTKFDPTGKTILQAGTALGTGSNIEAYDDLLYALFEQSNVGFTGSNGQAVFNYSPIGSSEISKSMSVVNFYTDFANPSKDTYSWDTNMGSALNAFTSGKLGFFFGYSYHNSLIKARAPQLNVRILPLLQLDSSRPVNVANYWVQSVVKKSKNQNEAWALINYLTHSEATKTYLDKTGRPSALRAYITGQQEKKELAPFVSQALVAKNWYRGRSYSSARSALNYMLNQWLKSPGANKEQVKHWQELLDFAAAQINQSL